MAARSPRPGRFCAALVDLDRDGALDADETVAGALATFALIHGRLSTRISRRVPAAGRVLPGAPRCPLARGVMWMPSHLRTSKSVTSGVIRWAAGRTGRTDSGRASIRAFNPRGRQLAKSKILTTDDILVMLCTSVKKVLTTATQSEIHYSPMAEDHPHRLRPDIGCFVLFDGGFADW